VTQGRVCTSVYRSQLPHLDQYWICYHHPLHVYQPTLVCNCKTISYICNQALAYVPFQSLGFALPKSKASISQKGYKSVPILMKTIINRSWFWLDNILKYMSTKHCAFLVFSVRSMESYLAAVMYNHRTGCLYRQRQRDTVPAPIRNRALMERQRFFALHYW
jgi:hypothetical protein